LVDTILAASVRRFKVSWPDAYDSSEVCSFPVNDKRFSECKSCIPSILGMNVARFVIAYRGRLE